MRDARLLPQPQAVLARPVAAAEPRPRRVPRLQQPQHRVEAEPVWCREHALIQMANDTGGKFYYVYDKKDLVPAFTHLSDDLRTQYTLGYYAPEKGGDKNGFRRITLRLKDPALAAKYTLRYRTGYYAERDRR